MANYRASKVDLIPENNYVIATGDVDVFEDPSWKKIGEFNTTVLADHKLVSNILEIVESIAKNHAMVSDLIPKAIQKIETAIIEAG